MEMNIEKMAIKITEKVLDDLLYKGKTLREWINLIIKFEKEYEKFPMGKYPTSISGCNMEEDKPKDEKFLCMNCKNRSECFIYDIYGDSIKEHINKNPNNDIKCFNYEKEK